MMEVLHSQVHISLCGSVHMSGISSPTMEDDVDGKEVHVIDTGSRELQSIFFAS